MLNSAFWIAMIVAGAAIVAVSNIAYNRARDAENKTSKAMQVHALLHGELQRNTLILSQMDESVRTKTSLSIQTFETTGWQTVSSGDLLLGLPNDELALFLQTYGLLNRANSLHAKILDLLVGLPAALEGSGKTRNLYFDELSSVLDQLKPLMHSLTGRTAPSPTL